MDGGRLVACDVQRRDPLLPRASWSRIRAASCRSSARSEVHSQGRSGSRAKCPSGAASAPEDSVTPSYTSIRWTRAATRPSSRSISSALLISSGRADSGGSSRTTGRVHTAGTSRAWFHNHGIDLIDWPAWSPDLNPIEKLWNDLKRRVYAHHLETMEELEHCIAEEWAATDLEFHLSHLSQHASPPANAARQRRT